MSYPHFHLIVTSDFVNMVDVQTIGVLVTATSLTVAAIYYMFTLRMNQRNMKASLQTRQAQLLMQIYQRFSETDFMIKFLTTRTREIKNYDDFTKIYSERDNVELTSQLGSLFAYFEGIGVLVEEKLIDPRLVANLMSGNIILFWEKYGPFLLEYRRRRNSPREWNKTEYLYGEMKKIRGEEWSHVFADSKTTS